MLAVVGDVVEGRRVGEQIVQRAVLELVRVDQRDIETGGVETRVVGGGFVQVAETEAGLEILIFILDEFD